MEPSCATTREAAADVLTPSLKELGQRMFLFEDEPEFESEAPFTPKGQGLGHTSQSQMSSTGWEWPISPLVELIYKYLYEI